MTAPVLHEVLVSPLLGGAGLVAVRLAAAAKTRGFSCTAWVPGPGPASRALQEHGVSWKAYDLASLRQSVVRQMWACARMLPSLIRHPPPLVHVHNPTVYRLLRPALRAARARTVVHFQIEPTPEEVRWALRYPPAHVIACAKYIAEDIRRQLADLRSSTPVTALPNAIDLERFAPGPQSEARRRVGLQTDRSVLLMMANLAPHKGQETALRALQILLARGLSVECWLAGEDRNASGDYAARLRELAEGLGVAQHVRFLGFRADAPDLLRAADVLLLPSRHEGLPLTILEAQAARIPVVASTIPGVREVVEHGVTGMTIPAEDCEGYADAIQTILSDSDLRARLTGRAFEQVHREYAWGVFERRVFHIYESLSGAHGRAREASLSRQ